MAVNENATIPPTTPAAEATCETAGSTVAGALSSKIIMIFSFRNEIMIESERLYMLCCREIK
jgi:hypothetical protein